MSLEKSISLAEFKMFQQLVYDEIGIFLAEHKRTLVQSRLRKWLREFNLPNYESLYEKIKQDKSGQMLTLLVNAITTNVTSFFREESQWIYLQENINNLFNKETKTIRIWSAACSSGQEPYSIMIFLKEHLDDFNSWNIKILATDISKDILQKAIKGVYTQDDVKGISKHILIKYFNKIKNTNLKYVYEIKDELKKYVTFRGFNLVTGDFSIFKNSFDFIFCRNVMIYFDATTKVDLFQNFSKLLTDKSRLFIGHSESIHAKGDTFKLVSPSIYTIK